MLGNICLIYRKNRFLNVLSPKNWWSPKKSFTLLGWCPINSG